jgi:hypothetical protein
MNQGKLLVALAALPMVLGGCDIFAPDSLDPPGITLTGRVMYNGEPVPVRTPGGTQLRVWHTSWERDDEERQPEAMGISLNTDGSYSAKVYPGEYDIQLLENAGPWVNDTTRIPIVVNGDMQVDIPVQPYYIIADENIVYTPPAAGEANAGRITGTFRVVQGASTAPAVELVGLYVSTTIHVDRTRRETSLQVYPAPAAGQNPPSNPHERSRAQVQTQLTNNQPITIALTLPENIRLTRSPAPRTTLYARVGVKTTGVAELAYSEVIPISIVVP